MFERLFQYIRQGVRQAVVAGIDDAGQDLAIRAEQDGPPLLETTASRIGAEPAVPAIEVEPAKPANGKSTKRR